MVPLLLGTLHHGTQHRQPADLRLVGAGAAAVVAVVDGVDGALVDHNWPPSQRLHGLGEVALVLGPNHLRSFLNRLGVVSQLP